MAEPARIAPAELRIVDVIEETADARSLVFGVPPELSRVFDYRPGQFLTLRIPSERTGAVARSYSLSSTPGIDAHLKVTVKRTDGGYASNWLCDSIRVGDLITVLPPSGSFVLRRLDADLLLFAGGSGITPVISILKAALRDGTGRIRLVYANRDRDSVIFRAELNALAEKHPDRLSMLHWYDDEHGYPDIPRVADAAASHPDADAYLCGPPPFMRTVADGLRHAGFGADRVHREVFSSLSGNPFDEVAPVPEEPADQDAGSAGAAKGVVHLDGETHEVAWPRDRTLVDVLLARGIDVPYSCRSGECGSCACRLVSGEVSMAPTEAMDQEDIDEGYLLGCQTRPASDEVEIAF